VQVIKPIAAESSPSIGQRFTVGKSGADYTSISDALDAADLVATSSNRILIEVYPGDFSENNPLSIPDYVTLNFPARHEITRVIPQNLDQHAFVIGRDTELIGARVRWESQSNSGTAAYHILSTAQDTELHDCAATNADASILCDSTSTDVLVRSFTINGGASTYGIRLSAGAKLYCKDISMAGGAIVDYPIDLGANSHGHFDMFDHADSGVFVYGINMAAGSVLHGSIMRLTSNSTGTTLINNGGTAVILGLQTEDVAIGIDCLGGGSTSIHGAEIVAGTTDLRTQTANDTVMITGGSLSRKRLSLFAGSGVYATFLDTSIVGDEAIVKIGELATGLPGAGSEAIFGEGDSYSWNMQCWQWDDNLAAFTDVTTSARDQSANDFGFTSPIGVDDALLIASPTFFVGIKINVVTPQTPDANTALVWEYWDGASWQEFKTMQTLAAYPYTKSAKFEALSSGVYQVRFDCVLDGLVVADNNVAGELPDFGENLYCVRVRVDTQVPTVEPSIRYIKVHTNRHEANSDGFIESFGRARQTVEDPPIYPENLSRGSVNVPTNIDVDITATLVHEHLRNGFTNNTTKQVQGTYTLGSEVDTSCPLVLKIVWLAADGNAGNVEWEVEVAPYSNDDVLDGSISGVVSTSVVAASGTALKMQETSISLDVSDIGASAALSFMIKRDATVGNLDDTYANTAIMHYIKFEKTIWRG